MIQLAELTNDEIKYICEQIPVPVVRTYFQKNPRGFTEIKKGFRPDKLTDAETLSVLIRNISKPYISSFVEKTLNKWLNEIDEYKTNLINEGYSEGEALLKTIPDSFFGNNSDLYFKLNGSNTDSEYVILFKDALSLIEKMENERDDAQTIKNQSLDIEKKNNQIEELLNDLGEKNDEIKKLTNELITTKDSLKASDGELSDCKEKLGQITEELTEAKASVSAMMPELERYRYLESNSDNEYENEEKYQHISVGEICHDMSGQIRICRIADIIDGAMIPFHTDGYSPKAFNNRDRLYWKDGPDKDGDVGVWGWRADPRDTDPALDYVTTEFLPFVKLTEIVEISDSRSISDITKIITEKFELKSSSTKMLLTYSAANESKEGLLCNATDFDISGADAKLLSSVFLLRKYQFTDSDCIQIGDKKFYKYINLGTPQGIVRPRTPFEVIKKLLLNRVSVPILREKGLSKKEAQKCLAYFKEIPEETIEQEFIEAYECSETEAKEYIGEFIEHVESYLTDNDFDMNILTSALSRNEELISRCKDALKEEWEAEYSEQMNSLNSKLAEVERIIIDKTNCCERLTHKKEELTADIAEKEKLAVDVEERISERILDAKNNAADFISQMAFLSPICVSNTTVNRSVDSVIRKTEIDYKDCGEIEDIDTFEEELSENLIISGFEDSASIETAQAIRFCISNKMPLIVNENAQIIANCAAGIIGGKQVKECFIPLTANIIDILPELLSDDGINVILIHGMLDGYSNNLFNAFINTINSSKNNKLYVVSIQGLDPKILPKEIWNHSLYVNGDEHYSGLATDTLNSYKYLASFDSTIDEKAYSAARKELSSFDEIVSNTAKNIYAKYLSLYGLQVRASWLIQLQLKTIARSLGSEKELDDLFRKSGIDVIDNES